MSDFQDDDQTDDEPQLEPRDLRRKLKEANARAKEAEQRAKTNEDAARELVFTKAGVDTNDPRAVYFVRGYEGEMTPDAIGAEAIKLGLAAPPPRTDVPVHEQEATRRFSDVAAGQEAPDPDRTYYEKLAELAKTPKKPGVAEEVEALALAHRNRLRGTPFG